MDFEVCTLADIAHIQGGYAFKSSDFGDYEIPVVKIANITPPVVSIKNADRIKKNVVNGLERFKLHNGDILMAMTGATVGKVGRFRVTEEAYLNQRVARITAKNIKLNDFLYAVVSQPGFEKQIEGAASGSAQANISAAGIGLVKLIKLPETTQIRIGSIISTIDDRIDLLKQTNQTLEAIAQTIFKSWFVNFDPVHAKQQGLPCAGIDAETAELFPDSFEDSELGQIPKGWQATHLGHLIAPKKGRSITKAKCIDGQIPVVAGGLEPAYYHNESNAAKPCVTISASGANAGFVRLYQENIWASDCSFISQEQTKELYFWYLFLKLNQEKIYFMQQGAAQPHIYPSDLMRLKICVPENDKIQKIFNSKVTPLFEQIGLGKQKIQTLAKIRDTLLPRLISGKLDVSAITAEVEEVA